MDTLFEQAKERIATMGFTDGEEAFIFSDWNEGDEHYKWLLTATKEEIDNWIDEEVL